MNHRRIWWLLGPLMLIGISPAVAAPPTLTITMRLAEAEWQVIRQEVLPPFERTWGCRVRAIDDPPEALTQRLKAMRAAGRMEIDLFAQDNMRLQELVKAGLVQALNHLYRSQPALHQVDFEPAGFQWIDCNDWEGSVVAFLRRARDPEKFLVFVCNFTPLVRHGYRIGVPRDGFYRERLNSDAAIYGGSNVGNAGGVWAAPLPEHGFPFSFTLTLPPLAALVLQPEDQR